MKKLGKIIRSVFIIILVLILALVALVVFDEYTAKNWSPMRQPNTEWVSEDGKITFVTKDDGDTEVMDTVNGRDIPVKISNIYTRGTVTIDGKSTEVVISQHVCGNTIWVFPTNTEVITDGQYDSWEGYFISKKTFIAVVEYDGLFFKKGEILVFHRQD